MDTDRVTEMHHTHTTSNKEACKKYYERNSSAAKRRVLLNEISRQGRLPKETTLLKWQITIHEVITAFREYKAKNDNIPPHKIIAFRVLVGNML